MVDIATTPTTPSVVAAKGIVIQEPTPAKSSPKKVPKRKGKKKLKETSIAPSQELTPSPLKKARIEAQENKLREEAWLSKQKNKATSIGVSEQRRSSLSQEAEQHFVMIEE